MDREVDAGEFGRVKIRPATSRDARGWIDLLERVTAEGPFLALETVNFSQKTLSRFLRMRAWSEDGAAIVADAGGRIVGQLSATRERGIYRHIAEIGMSVDAAFRRKGIGRGLIDAAIDWARTFGVEKLVLNVFPRNSAAIALYRKAGFVEEGMRSRQARMSHGYEDLMEMSLFV